MASSVQGESQPIPKWKQILIYSFNLKFGSLEPQPNDIFIWILDDFWNIFFPLFEWIIRT